MMTTTTTTTCCVAWQFRCWASGGNAATCPSPQVRMVAASTLGDLGLEHPMLRSQAAALLLKGLERYGEDDRYVWGSFYNGALTLAEVERPKRPLRPEELTPERL